MNWYIKSEPRTVIASGLLDIILGPRTPLDNEITARSPELAGGHYRADSLLWRTRNSEYAQRLRDQWRPILSRVHERRNQLRKKAEQVAKELGHFLGPWHVFQDNRCRKCGAVVKLENVLTSDTEPYMIGRAISERCWFANDDHTKTHWGEFKERDPDFTLI